MLPIFQRAPRQRTVRGSCGGCAKSGAGCRKTAGTFCIFLRQFALGTQLINRERARCQRFGAAARRECFRTGSPSARAVLPDGQCFRTGTIEYPLWIFDRRATRQQRQRSATRRAVFWRAPGCVASQSQSHGAMLLRRALPATRQKTARPFPIYEMGSKKFLQFLSVTGTMPRCCFWAFVKSFALVPAHVVCQASFSLPFAPAVCWAVPRLPR